MSTKPKSRMMAANPICSLVPGGNHIKAHAWIHERDKECGVDPKCQPLTSEAKPQDVVRAIRRAKRISKQAALDGSSEVYKAHYAGEVNAYDHCLRIIAEHAPQGRRKG